MHCKAGCSRSHGPPEARICCSDAGLWLKHQGPGAHTGQTDGADGEKSTLCTIYETTHTHQRLPHRVPSASSMSQAPAWPGWSKAMEHTHPATMGPSVIEAPFPGTSNPAPPVCLLCPETGPIAKPAPASSSGGESPPVNPPFPGTEESLRQQLSS